MKQWLLGLSLLVGSVSGWGVEATKIRFELPVNWAATPRYTLDVVIPEGFTSLQTIDQWSAASTTLIEFVPSGQTGEDWTEIVTLNKYLDQKMGADAFVEALTARLKNQVQNSRIWQEKTEHSPAYTRALSILSYDYNNKHEVLGMLYYSGPYDCVGIQYTIRTSKDLSDEQAVAKIENYFQTSTEVISH